MFDPVIAMNKLKNAVREGDYPTAKKALDDLFVWVHFGGSLNAVEISYR